jgi:hypothetical protein
MEAGVIGSTLRYRSTSGIADRRKSAARKVAKALGFDH